MREITINDLNYIYHYMAANVRWLKNDYNYFLPRIDNELSIVSGFRVLKFTDIEEGDSVSDKIAFDSLSLKVYLENTSQKYDVTGSVIINSSGGFAIDGIFDSMKEFEGIQLLISQFTIAVEKCSKEVK